MKYLFINSMSRTGTSLLYQLLFGHPEIYFAPFRMQFVCSKPFGFPLTCYKMDKKTFFNALMNKTTIVYKKGKWPNISVETLAKAFPEKMTLDNLVFGITPLETAIRTIHNVLEIEMPTKEKYYCLHDDHSYMLGGRIFSQYDGRILTTIRNPLDMIASKKNMLTMYVYGRKEPKQFNLKREVMEKELLRAYFSWWSASYEYNSRQFLPLLYSFIKNQETRKEVMFNVSKYLDIEFNDVLLTDKVVLEENGLYNELLANGSSLSTIEYLSKGNIKQQIDGSVLSLNESEISYIKSIIDFNEVNRFCRYVDFYDLFNNFYKAKILKIYQDLLDKWKQLYSKDQQEELFARYSSLNYGRNNAADAFGKK